MPRWLSPVAALVAATVVFCPAPTHAQAPLRFLGFTPGASWAATESALATHQGRWRCSTSQVDRRFTECRGQLAPAGEPALQLTASLVRDSLAILLLTAQASDTTVARWTEALTQAYGAATVRSEHGVTARQWIRARRMIRVTSRREGGRQMVSVSLVDGVRLDALNATSSPPASSLGRASPPS